jgi:acyl carrier protein
MEKKIAGVLRKLLGQDRVGVEENFFDLGGHSLLAVQIHSELRESLKMAFPLVALFEYPTIRSLARHLDDPAVPAMAAGDQWRERAARHKQALSQMRTKKGSK